MKSKYLRNLEPEEFNELAELNYVYIRKGEYDKLSLPLRALRTHNRKRLDYSMNYIAVLKANKLRRQVKRNEKKLLLQKKK